MLSCFLLQSQDIFLLLVVVSGYFLVHLLQSPRKTSFFGTTKFAQSISMKCRFISDSLPTLYHAAEHPGVKLPLLFPVAGSARTKSKLVRPARPRSVAACLRSGSGHSRRSGRRPTGFVTRPLWRASGPPWRVSETSPLAGGADSKSSH